MDWKLVMSHLEGAATVQMQLTVLGRNSGPKFFKILIFQEKGQVLIFKCWQVILKCLDTVQAQQIYLWPGLAWGPPAGSSALELVMWRPPGPFRLEWNINCVAYCGYNFSGQPPNQLLGPISCLCFKTRLIGLSYPSLTLDTVQIFGFSLIMYDLTGSFQLVSLEPRLLLLPAVPK